MRFRRSLWAGQAAVILLILLTVGMSSRGVSQTLTFPFPQTDPDLGHSSTSSPLMANASYSGGNSPNGCGGLPVSYQFQSSVSGGTSPYYYGWSFGDGSPNSTQANPSHNYRAFGLYKVNFTVTDSNGARTYSNLSLEVYPPPCADPAFPLGPDLAYVLLGLTFIVVLILGIAFLLYPRRKHRAK